jgi:hypothetical protein
VRAKICKQAEEYKWSSANYHLDLKKSDLLIQRKHRGIGRPKEWTKWLESDPSGINELRHYFRVGRPYGGEAFIKQAELITAAHFFLKKQVDQKINNKSTHRFDKIGILSPDLT